jgi:SAM-dependent methyltransferase
MQPAGADDKAILHEAVELAARQPELGWLQFRSFVGAHQYLRLYRLFRGYVPLGADVLDWGAGNGHFSYFLQRAGYRASGYSFSECTYRDTLPDPSYRFLEGSPNDPVSLPFQSSQFDAVTSVGVLEHVRETGGDEVASLREIVRVLRPGGLFIAFHLPNRHSMIEVVARRFPHKHHHEYRYTRADIVALTAGAGMRLLEVKRYGILPRNVGHRLPSALRRSQALATGWDLVDLALAVPFSPIGQNYLVVARKPGGPALTSPGEPHPV